MLTVDQLEMFGDRILVDPDPKIEASEGGLVIPQVVLADNPNYFNMTGVVVKLGDGIRVHTFQCLNCNVLTPDDDGPCPGCHQPLGNKNTRIFETADERTPFDVQVGDRVLFNRFAGKQVELVTSYGVIRTADGDLLLGRRDADDPTIVRAEPITKRFLIMRESEVLGVVDGDHRITPGYQAPKWGKVTDGLTL